MRLVYSAFVLLFLSQQAGSQHFGTLTRISEQQNAHILRNCGVRIDMEAPSEVRNRKKPIPRCTKAKKKFVMTANNPGLVFVHNYDRGHACMGFRLSNRHILTLSSCLTRTKETEQNEDASYILPHIEIRSYYTVENNRDEENDYTYHSSRVRQQVILDTQHRMTNMATFIVLETDVVEGPLAYACLPPAYQWQSKPDEDLFRLDGKPAARNYLFFGDRELSDFATCANRTRDRRCGWEGMGGKVLQNYSGWGRRYVYFRDRSLNIRSPGDEMRTFFAGYWLELGKDRKLLSVTPLLLAICRQTGVCHDEFNIQGLTGDQQRGDRVSHEVILNGETSTQETVQKCTDSLKKLTERENRKLQRNCSRTVPEDSSIKIHFVTAIYTQLGDHLFRFACWATLISKRHAIAPRDCDFETLENGNLWLMYGDADENPMTTCNKSIVRGYTYMPDYGVSIIELEDPVKNRDIACFPSRQEMLAKFNGSKDYDEPVLDLRRDTEQFEPDGSTFYGLDERRTRLDRVGTATLLEDSYGNVTLFGIRLKGDEGFSFDTPESRIPDHIFVLQLHVISDIICKLLGVCPDGYNDYDRDRVPTRYWDGNIFCPIDPPQRQF